MSLLTALKLKPTSKMVANQRAAAEAATADQQLLRHIKEAWQDGKATRPGADAKALVAAVEAAGQSRKQAAALADPAQRAAALKAAAQRLQQDIAAAHTPAAAPGPQAKASAQPAQAAPVADGPASSAASEPASSQASAPARSSSPPSKGKPKPKGKTVTTIDMDADEIVVPVSKGDPGDTGEVQIKDLLQSMRDNVQDYWATYSRGLESFQTSMSFSSAQEAESKYLQVAFKTVGKKALDMALDEAGKALGGPWGTVISTAKGVAEAWVAESERVAAAEGQVKIRDYIISIRNGISAQQQAMTAVIEAAKSPMIQEFRRLAANDYSKGKASDDGVVIGEAAGLVNSLRKAVKAFKSKMVSESYFQQQFARNFADTPGRSDLISHGGVPTGMIYFGIRVYVDPTENEAHPPWEVKEKDEAWKLVTKAPNPDRVAESLTLSLGGRKPWDVELPKMVKMSVEVEESGLNSYVDGWIYFTQSPDQYEVRTNYDPKWLDLAWKQSGVRSVALNNAKLIGGSDY